MESYFHRSLSGPAFEGHEEKKYEFCRYGSFKDWPSECPIFPSVLAKAGFFYTGNGDEAVCYVCGTRKSDWTEGDDPEVIHREINRQCPFFSQSFEDNIPISASAVSGEEISNDQRLSDLDRLFDGVSLGDSLVAEQRENSNDTENGENLDENSNRRSMSEDPGAALRAETSSSRQNQRLPSNTEGQGQNGMPRSKSSDSILSSSSRSAGAVSAVPTSNVADAVRNNTKGSSRNQGNRKNQGLDIPPPTGAAIGPLRFERNRLATFKKWPSGAKVSAADLAKAGFTYTGSGDRVQCVFCKGILRNWEEGDRPHIEHRKHFPRCPLILGIEKGNVPLPLGQTTRNGTNNTQDSAHPILNAVEGDMNMESLGITTDRPKHAQFAIEAQRVASFHNWPAYKHQTPQQLAEAGFFYAGFSDNVKCFYCNGGLRNWEKGDDPWHEHARWFKTCPFVLMVKGQDYINAVSVEMREDEPILVQSNRNAEGSTIAERVVGYEVEEREVRARMDPPHVKVVEGMGVKRDVIMSAIRKRLQQTGDDFPSATALLEAVFLMEEEAGRGQQSQSSTVQNGSQLRQQEQNGTDVSEQKTRELEENEEKTKTSSDEEPEQAGNQMKRSSSMPECSLNSDDLLKENTELKEQKLCKICMVSDVNIVFLPCGHLVACATCAPALQMCPICRAAIKGTVRTYMS